MESSDASLPNRRPVSERGHDPQASNSTTNPHGGKLTTNGAASLQEVLERLQDETLSRMEDLHDHPRVVGEIIALNLAVSLLLQLLAPAQWCAVDGAIREKLQQMLQGSQHECFNEVLQGMESALLALSWDSDG